LRVASAAMIFFGVGWWCAVALSQSVCTKVRRFSIRCKPYQEKTWIVIHTMGIGYETV